MADNSQPSGLPPSWTGSSDVTVTPSTDRIVVTGSGTANWDLLYNGVSIRGLVNGYNWGNYSTISLPLDVNLAIADGVSLVRPIGYNRWMGPYGVTGTDSRDDACYASFGPQNRDFHYQSVVQLGQAGIWSVVAFDSDCAINGGMQDGPGGSDATFCEALVQPGEVPMTMDASGNWTVIGGSPTWDAVGGYNVFTSPVLFHKVRRIWKMLATLYAPLPKIFAYELGSEPMAGAGFNYDATWSPRLQSFYRILINDIRQIDPYTPFVIGARGGYNLSSINEMILSERTDCIYTFDLLSSVVKTIANIPGKYDNAGALNVPMYVNQNGTQSSDDPNDYAFNGSIAIAKARGYPCCLWQAKDKGTTANGYGWRYSDGAGGFIDKTQRITYGRARFAETLASLEAAAQSAATAAGATLIYCKPDLSNVFAGSGGSGALATIGGKFGSVTPVVGSGVSNLAQATSANQPTVVLPLSTGYYLIDNRPWMLFDGVNTYLNGSAAYFSPGDDMTVIAAGIPANAATTQHFVAVGISTTTDAYPTLTASSGKLGKANWAGDDGVTTSCTGTTSTAAFPCVLSAKKAGTAMSLYVNGLSEGTATATVGTIASLSRLRVGGNTNNTPSFTGPIALICLCKGGMTDPQRQAIERFAARLVGAGYQV